MPLPEATMCSATSSPERPGDVAVKDGDVVAVDAQQSESGASVTGDVGGDRLQAQAVSDGFGHEGLVLDDQHAHALAILRPEAYHRRTGKMTTRTARVTSAWQTPL